MINKEKLKDYAAKLMFDMKEEEYETLQNEFEVILKQMDLIDKIKDIDKIKPMTFPFVNYEASLREDVVTESLSTEDILINAKLVSNDQVKVPKVVE
ncbi:MAG: Asp-tRNA(Asn)/Glu-tRNA(Gln) amidotransferase subunit GatC [Bacilli bacterium]|nr:Asp-tRNA(Asn)/Glu-tRNA(Gln) amidotransferase subunit GatC [Bacilli bacterium]